MAFGAGPRVYVRLPDGSGMTLKRVRIERVEPDGTQTVTSDEVERYDLESTAREIREEPEP
jgi:hypothetical protein